MKLCVIREGLDVAIQHYNQDGDVDDVGEKCYRMARDSGINISSNKNLTLVAYAAGEPAGAIWSAFERDQEASDYHGQDIYRYDFDVVVHPQARVTGLTSARIGPQLIDAALRYYKELKQDVPGAYVRVWVVNPRLARYLENHCGFETEGRGWSPDTPHMTYYG
jgi:ribosomal protein S18 acetylase RimI-like enzyme